MISSSHDIRDGVLRFPAGGAVGPRAVLVDRDGTLIEELHYARDESRVRLRSGVAEALRELRGWGFGLVAISNQSGVGRGILTVDDVMRTHARTAALLAGAGTPLDAAYYCLHAPEDGCECRKPGIGMLLRAAEDMGLELGRCAMIGDKESDLEAGRRAGCVAIAAGSDWVAAVSAGLQVGP
ncbi:MAG: HAD family hydrolase [Bryobacteraceae bacterium]